MAYVRNKGKSTFIQSSSYSHAQAILPPKKEILLSSSLGLRKCRSQYPAPTKRQKPFDLQVIFHFIVLSFPGLQKSIYPMWLLVNATSRRLALESWNHGGSIGTLFCLTTCISLLSEFSRVTTCSSASTDIPGYSVSESQISVTSSKHVVHCTSDFSDVRNETKYLCIVGWQKRSRTFAVSSIVSALHSRHKFYCTIYGEFPGLCRDSFLQFNVNIWPH
jgi:hypothetical protein